MQNRKECKIPCLSLILIKSKSNGNGCNNPRFERYSCKRCENYVRRLIVPHVLLEGCSRLGSLGRNI